MGHADKGFVFAKRPAWCIVLSSLCVAAQLYVWQNSGGFSTRLYLGRPWWIVIGGLQRKRWLGQKGREKDILKHALVEGDLGILDAQRHTLR